MPSCVEDMPLEQRLRTVIARLELCSEAPTQSYDKNGGKSAEEPGGKRPAGGVDRKGDRDEGNVLKSADHFKRRLARAHSERTLTLILHEAEASLQAHKRIAVSKDEPEYGTFAWKRWVCNSPQTAAEIARIYNCKRQHIEKIRATVA